MSKVKKENLLTTQTSIMSRIFLLWSIAFSKLSHQKSLTSEDMTEIEPSQAFEQVYKRWGSFWEESAKIDSVQASRERLKWTMKKTFKQQIINASLMSFFAYQLSALTPLLIFWISQQKSKYSEAQNLIFLILIFALKISKSFLTMHSQYKLKKIGGNIFCCLCSSLTQKSLKKLNFAKGQQSISQISKLAQYDCSKIIQYPLIYTQAVFELYSLVFTMVCLFFMANWQALASCLVLFALNLIRFVMVSIFKKYQKKVNQAASQRIKKENQYISNMKFIKVNALENLFYEKLNFLRKIEVNLLQKFLNLGIIASIMPNFATRFSIVVFIFLYLFSGNQMNPALIFTILLFYNFMALHRLINKANNLGDINISLRKIEEYLINKEKAAYINRLVYSKAQKSICIQGGNFYWQKQIKSQVKGIYSFSLKDIVFTIQKGEFIAFIGEFGSGKSSIINAIIGQMDSESSKVAINGSIAYANQMPWILNDSVKNNILFGEEFQEKRYKQALHFSRLEKDLSLFAKGEDTVIGEKGSTLSGGQKARISLARAIYRQANIYILDDILSALDAHVGAFIFQQTLAKHLRGKTIILATHLVNYLHLVDRVFHIENGKIKETQTNPTKNQNKKQKVWPKYYEQFRKLSEQYEDYETAQQTNQELQLMNSSIMHQQISQLQLFKRLIKRRGGFMYIISTIFFLLLMIVTNLLLIYWLNLWVNSQDCSNFYYYSVYLTILAISVASIGLHALVQFNSSFFYEIHRQMIMKIITAPMSYFEGTSISNSMNKLSHDLKKVDNQVITSFRDSLFYISLGVSFIVNSIITYIKKDQKLMIVLLIVSIILIVYYYFFFIVAIRKMHQLQQESQIPIYSSFVEILFGASTIRAYKKEQFMKQNQRNKIQIYLKTRKIMTGIESYFTFIISIITTVVTTTLFIKILLLNDKLDFFLIYNIFSFQRSVENLHKFLSQFLSNLKYLGYCQELMSIPQEQGYEFVQKDGKNVFKDKVESQKWIKQGKIEFSNYSVKYRPELQTVLKNLTLQIKPKEKIGVVGRTGSGKSTTVLSLLRILQLHEGSIKIDGVDLYSIDIQTLRAGFSIILQDHFLFSGTIRENIDPLDEFFDDKIINALDLCGLWDSLKGRNGLDTKVEQGGNNFSAGERQLINISRVFLNPKKIVLIDEATACIDFKSDEMLQRIIKQKLKDCTVFTIAHRIDTIFQSDRIIAFDKGRIIEKGAPSQLLNSKDSAFKSLYKQSQKRQINDIQI